MAEDEGSVLFVCMVLCHVLLRIISSNSLVDISFNNADTSFAWNELAKWWLYMQERKRTMNWYEALLLWLKSSSNSWTEVGHILSLYRKKASKQKFFVNPRRNDRSSQPVTKCSNPTNFGEGKDLALSRLNAESSSIHFTKLFKQQYCGDCPMEL